MYWRKISGNSSIGENTGVVLAKDQWTFVNGESPICESPIGKHPSTRAIETVWTVLERKIYENNWEAKTIDHLVKRIKQKAKELDQEMLQGMIEDVGKKLRAMWRDGLYSVL